MVYVALTVATCSAIIMCCTWFITHNSEVLRWWKGDHYGVVNEEEHVELRKVEESDEESNDEDTIFESRNFKDKPEFTLDDSSEDIEDEEEISSKEIDDDKYSAV
tara:strand:+ start:882 stop:1196 length:315 start_codon:yes stop_codon:yes gene_type:complete